MPKYARGSDIDLDEAYGALLDKHAPMRRNIRTKTDMHRTHHCEDKECGGAAPKAKCIIKLHFAFCLAPVVDEDSSSPTYGHVVIHGQRFAVISPQGCAEHPYRAEYNLDLKDVRNGRADYEIRWKKIFNAFQVEHQSEMQREVARMNATQKEMGMTSHQKQTLRTRQDNFEYQQQRKLDIAAKTTAFLKSRHEEINLTGNSLGSSWSSIAHLRELKPTLPEPREDVATGEIGAELALRIGAVTGQDLRSMFSSLWLHGELFEDEEDSRENVEQHRDWASVNLEQPKQLEVAVPNAGWLQNQLFHEVDSCVTDTELGKITAPSVVDKVPADSRATQALSTAVIPLLRRKEAKQVKRERATRSRALARTVAVDIATQAADKHLFARSKHERKAQRPKGLSRTAMRKFA
ncbi:hypothetical protein BDU57DRAFT_519065 [Ampelomyces quisqualis]|uniref:Uncharacterized protein n=1 Tax=Ampelomyces quisqualis TaxID=50730 RepID=A0A6A5QFT4_AMPQU|nr:hypothetical protein BDU57DRAFT_519065 [Ampelomyces quisqualis]